MGGSSTPLWPTTNGFDCTCEESGDSGWQGVRDEGDARAKALGDADHPPAARPEPEPSLIRRAPPIASDVAVIMPLLATTVVEAPQLPLPSPPPSLAASTPTSPREDEFLWADNEQRSMMRKTTHALVVCHAPSVRACEEDSKADTNDFQIFERMQDFKRRNSMVYVQLQILH